MGENTNTDLGLGARAWEVSKIYLGSNAVKRYNGVLENSSVRTLADYLRGPEGIEYGIDQDTKADDRLAKYNVTKMIPTKNLSEFDNAQEVYVITDAAGHDIGILTMTDNGNMEFRLDPKIADANKKILGKFPEHQRKAIAEKYALNPENLSAKDMSLKSVVERLSKGQTISIMSAEQVKVECKDEIEKANEAKKIALQQQYGGQFEVEYSSNDNQEELEEEFMSQQRIMEKIPEDMRTEIIQKCQEKGLRIKDILVVTCPETLAKSIDNKKTQITRGGGPVVLIQAAHGGADSLGDDIYSFQDGGELQHTEENDDKLTSVMEENRGKGTITDINDNSAQKIELEILAEMEIAQQKIEEQQRIIEEAQAKIDYLNGQEFESPEEKKEAINALQGIIDTAQLEIENIGQELAHRVDVIKDNSNTDYGTQSDGEMSSQTDNHEEHVHDFYDRSQYNGAINKN